MFWFFLIATLGAADELERLGKTLHGETIDDRLNEIVEPLLSPPLDRQLSSAMKSNNRWHLDGIESSALEDIHAPIDIEGDLEEEDPLEGDAEVTNEKKSLNRQRLEPKKVHEESYSDNDINDDDLKQIISIDDYNSHDLQSFL